MKHLLIAVALALVGLTAAPPAQAVTYSNGDLFLGFRASDGAGANQDYLVNLGPASQFIGANSAITVTAVGNIGADLTALFGSDWSTRSDVYWSVSGANLASDPENTLYATRARVSADITATAWAGRSNSAQGVTDSKFNALAGAYLLGAATANSSVGIIQNTSEANSYASFQPGGTTANSGGISFGAFNPSIEASFANGASGSILDLFRVVPVFGQASQHVGSFSLSSGGVLTFTPAPTVGTVRFETTQTSVSEEDASGHVTVKILRSGAAGTSFTVNLSTVDGTAVGNTDFTAQTNTPVPFAANQLQATVDIPIANRPGYQGDRTFTVSLSGATAGGAIGSPASATVAILETSPNPAGAFSFSAATYQQAENASGDAILTVTVNRVGGQTGAVGVNVAVTGGTATSGVDYTVPASPVTLAWAHGDGTAKTFDITIKADASFEANETIALALQNPTGGASLGAQASATATILDGTPVVPGSVSFSSAAYQKSENASGDALLAVTVNRTAGQNGAVSVDVVVTGGTASSGADYTLPSNVVTLSWADNESGSKSFNITVKADVLAEGGETIDLALQNPAGGVTIGQQSSATVTITDPADSSAPTLSLKTPAVNAKLTAAAVTLAGNAKDNLGVARVEVRLNGGAPQSVVPPNATADFNWTLSIVPEQGVNTVEIRAFDLLNNSSAPLTRKFTFKNLRPSLAGKYNGLIVASTAPITYSGLAAVTVTSTGAFTGKVTLAGVTLPISGVFLTSGEARFGKTLTPTLELVKKVKPAPISLGRLSLSLDTGAGHKITGAIKDAAGAQTFAEIPQADQALYTAKKNPVAPLRNVPLAVLDPAKEKGRYTAIFQAGSAPNNGSAADAFPQGDGFGSVTVSTAGVVKIVGKLADGTAIAYANTLSVANEWPVFIPLYGKTGFVTGLVTFDSTQAQTDAAAPGVLWFKSQKATDKLYPAGWANGITVDFAASKYVVPAKPTTKVPNPANPDTALGAGLAGASATTTANVVIAVADGGLTADTSNDASIDAKSKITVLGATAGGAGANGLKAALVASTGALSGSFIHPGSGKVVKYSGVAFQKTHTASGFFLYFPPAAQAGAKAESGAVGVAAR